MIDSKRPERDEARASEEVQTIIDRMPTGWVKWVALCVTLLMGVVIMLGFIIQYPDTVDGQISVTATSAPVRLVCTSSGRICMHKDNGSSLSKGDLIAHIESGANLSDMLLLDSLLLAGVSKDFPSGLILGELSQAYSSLLLAESRFERLSRSSLYKNMRSSIERQIEADEAVKANLIHELSLKENIVSDAAERLSKDSILFFADGISRQELEDKSHDFQIQQEALLSLNSSILSKESAIQTGLIESQRTAIQEAEAVDEAQSNLISALGTMRSAVEQWKERYLFTSPIDGTLEFLEFFRDNDYVQAGAEAFSILPQKNDIVGEVLIPAIGAGKVEVGQKVNVKMYNYPYDEYGYLTGQVERISRQTKRLQVQGGSSDVYLVTVLFPDGMMTNFGKALPIDFGNIGTAEIITKRKKLIHRLFDNLKSRGTK